MESPGINIEKSPELNNPILIAGFGGWGNAMGISTDTAEYLVDQLTGFKFAWIDPDRFYRYDEARPTVSITNGSLVHFTPPTGEFYGCDTGADTGDLVVFKGHEPNLAWNFFVQELFALCTRLGIKKIITLGSMYDRVIHTHMVVSGMCSSGNLYTRLMEHNVRPISYQGPSAIHSIIQAEGAKAGFQCASLWCHCPYYLQSGQHFGYISRLATLLASIGHFPLDVTPLDRNWVKLMQKIDHLISKNDELQQMVQGLKEPVSTPDATDIKPIMNQNDKVIDLRDFLPNHPDHSKD